MKFLNYDLVELRFNEIGSFKIIDVIYDEYESLEQLYLRNTFIIDFEHQKLIINSNVVYIEDEILFKIEITDDKIKQFVGIAKVIFDNMVEAIALKNNIENAEINILQIDDMIAERLSVIAKINKAKEDEEKLFKIYESLMIDIEMPFVSNLLSEEFIEKNIIN